MIARKQKYKIIVAIGNNNAIGDGNDLLWHLPADMLYFKNLTQGADVIMGRKTYESIPAKFRPLPNRTNIVISRDKNYKAAEGVLVCTSVNAAIAIAENCTETNKFIIGGGSIYAATIDFADELYITEINADFEDANTFFPDIDPHEWKEITREAFQKDEKNAYDYAFVHYERIK